MINFLRGVPADESLEKVKPLVAEGYQNAISKYGTDVLQYGHFSGFKPLREILGKMYDVDPERVVAGNGGMEVISLFFKSLPHNSMIITEAATYDRVAMDAVQYGHRIMGVEMTSQGVRLDQLEKLFKQTSAKVFYGIPYHQNPFGITYSEENRNAVEAICKTYTATCFWDICYESLRYDGKTNIPFKISEDGPVLMSSFTKTITPGTKCGYMILPKEMIGPMTNVIANTRINPNLPTQAFISEFIASGEYDKFLRYLCEELYRPRMDALNTAMKAHFPETNPTEITGGFFYLINLPSITEEKEARFIAEAKDAGVNVTSANAAFPPNILEKNRGKGIFIRLTFPAIEPEQIEKGIAAIKAAEARIKG